MDKIDRMNNQSWGKILVLCSFVGVYMTRRKESTTQHFGYGLKLRKKSFIKPKEIFYKI